MRAFVIGLVLAFLAVSTQQALALTGGTHINVQNGAVSFTGTITPTEGGTGTATTATTDRYLKGNGTNWITSTGAASGTGTCTNQFARALNTDAAPTCATVSLTADVTGILGVANGGTAVSSWTANNSVILSGTTSTGAVQIVAGGTAANLLVSAGAATAPTFTTINLASANAVGSSVLPVANGGTNLTAAADDNVMVGNGTTWETKALTNCTGAGRATTYATATNAWGCNTITAGVAPTAFFHSNDLTTSQTVFLGFNGGQDATEAVVASPSPAATFANLRCNNGAIQGTSNAVVMTGRVGACGSLADGTLTCSITGTTGANQSCSDVTNSIAPTAGQCVSLKVVTPAALTANARIACVVERTA